LGVLDVQADTLNAFNPDTVIALESLAGQLALALQESQTYDNEKRQSERVNAMADASRAVVSILNIDDLLDEVVDLVTDYFGYDRVHLFIRTGDRVVFRAGSGVHSGKWAVDRFSYHIDDNGFVPCVARNSQPLVSGEVYTDVHFVAMPGVEDSRSEMTVPIKIGNRVLGVFDIQSTQPSAFTSEDLTLMQALADTVAIGLRNASLFALETRRRILAETLREVSLVIASSLDLESVLDGILEGLERVIGYQAALIALIDDTGQHYIVSAVRAQKATANIVEMQIAITAELEKTIYDLLLQMEPPESNAPDVLHNHLAVALKVGGEQIGYMAIDRVGPDKFSPEEVEIVNTFGGQAAVAISNAQLYMAQREEAWVSNALLRVAEATGRATSLDEVLSTVAHITPELAGVEWCAVFLYENNQFRIVEIEGVEDDLAKSFHGHIFHDGDWALLTQLRISGQPIMIDRNTPAPTNMPTVIRDIGQAVLLPLYAKGEVMGALLIGQRTGVEPLSPRKIELVSGIANQAALAIESAQLFAAQQEEQWVTTALLTVAESLNSTIGLSDTMEALVRLTKMLVGTSFCAIMQWENDAKCFIGGAAYGVAAEHEKQFRELVIPANADSFISAVHRTQDPVSAGKGYDYPIPTALKMFNVEAIIALPLATKGVMVGAMFVDHPALSGVSDQRRMNILIGTAQQAALALETVRLQEDSIARQKIERELEVAQGIQRSFLPQQLPKLDGWDLSSFYRAARQVGGDFYDFIPLKSGKWGIVIADVADKGVPAALFMVLSRTNLRAAAFSRDDPVETLRRVNELLIADSRSDLFVTVWYGVFDPIKGEMEYANGGHNPPLLIHADGRSEELTADGIVLGVVAPIELESKRIVFQSGDALIAYTDGVTEAIRSDSTEFGVAALLRTASMMRAKPASEVLKQIIHEVDTFTAGEPQFDDLTLVVLKRDDHTSTIMTVQSETVQSETTAV
jgi:serine phosphatase RsbU (regulator of sigma subunit)